MDIIKLSPAGQVAYLLADMEKTHDTIFATGNSKTELVPVIIAISEDGKVAKLPIHNFMQSDKTKAVMSEIMPKLFEQMNVVAYAMASEAWMVKPNKSDTALVRPSKSDARVEVIMSHARHRSGALQISIREMIRDYKTGKVTELRKDQELTELLNGETMGGQFGNLFGPPDRTTYDDIKRDMERSER